MPVLAGRLAYDSITSVKSPPDSLHKLQTLSQICAFNFFRYHASRIQADGCKTSSRCYIPSMIRKLVLVLFQDFFKNLNSLPFKRIVVNSDRFESP